jgi:thimet oligopeptidase
MPAEIPAEIAATEDLHAWEAGGAASAPALTAWVSARLAAHEAALAALLAVEGPRTPENSLRLYDEAIEQLTLAGAQAGVLNSVAADKAVRDQAQEEAQRVSMAGSALSLNRAVYDALAAIDLEGASAATSILSSARCSAIGWPASTRTRPRATTCRRCTKRPRGSRSNSAATFRRAARPSRPRRPSWTACPPTTSPAIPKCRTASITLTTDQPDMQPVMTFAASAALRERMFLAYNTRAYPVNQQILLDLLATRQEIATVLGFRSWADLATADQMMGSAANVRTFLAKLDEASRDGARREHELIVDFARTRQPGLTAIDITSRGYWYEQFRRSAFDFDSQSVRPYFPYAQVEAGRA